MRKALEAYSTFNYGIGMKDLFRETSILNKIENNSERELFGNFMYRLVLNNESHTEDATKSYPDIDVYLMMDKEEKVNTAKLLLIFLQCGQSVQLGLPTILPNSHISSTPYSIIYSFIIFTFLMSLIYHYCLFDDY